MASEVTPEVAGGAGIVGVVMGLFAKWLWSTFRSKGHSTFTDIVGGDTPDPKELTAEWLRLDRAKQEERAQRLHRLGDIVNTQELRVGVMERKQGSLEEEVTELRIGVAEIKAKMAAEFENVKGGIGEIKQLMAERRTR